jgi:SAM-dependent methyltransferase
MVFGFWGCGCATLRSGFGTGIPDPESRYIDSPFPFPYTTIMASKNSDEWGVVSSECPEFRTPRRDIAEETLRTFSLTHNYNLWVIHLLAPYVGRRILEIGCGIGNMTCYLQSFGELSCVDVSELYLSHMKLDFPKVHFYQCDASDDAIVTKLRSLTRRPSPNGSEEWSEGFDTVTCINVLEHIRDDRKTLQNIHDLLEPGGRLLLFVPALQGLYSQLDRQLDHFRRYSRDPLRQLLEDTGFEIERLHYTNLIGTLGWFFNGKLMRKKQLSIWQTILFDKFAPLIERVERLLKPPFGMSLLAIARKPVQ